MTWQRGRTEIEQVIANGELVRVSPSKVVANRLREDAGAHIRLAAKGVEEDPTGTLN